MVESKMKTAGESCRFTANNLIWPITSQVASAVSEVSYFVFILKYAPIIRFGTPEVNGINTT